jgi:hypothetical protein
MVSTNRPRVTTAAATGEAIANAQANLPTIDRSTTVRHFIAGLLTATLITLATFSLTALSLVPLPQQYTLLDEMFGVLGLLSLIAAASIIDNLLDTHATTVNGGTPVEPGVTPSQRFTLFGGGYFLFTIVIGFMSTATLIVYASKNVQQGQMLTMSIIAAAIGIFLVIRLMTDKTSEIWLAAALLGCLLFSAFASGHQLP